MLQPRCECTGCLLLDRPLFDDTLTVGFLRCLGLVRSIDLIGGPVGVTRGLGLVGRALPVESTLTLRLGLLHARPLPLSLGEALALSTSGHGFLLDRRRAGPRMP